MFSKTFCSDVVSLFFSLGSDPLQLWSQHHDDSEKSFVKLVSDDILKSPVLKLHAETESYLPSTFIRCPAEPDSHKLQQSLSIKLQFITFIIRNLEKYFSFELELMDDQDYIRFFRASNWITSPKIESDVCVVPLQLDKDWISITIQLQNICKRAFGTNYKHLIRIQVHANCCIRRIYMTENLINPDYLPVELRLYAPKEDVK